MKQDRLALLKQWQEDPTTVEYYEAPPGSGYWLFIKQPENDPLLEIYIFSLHIPAKDPVRFYLSADTLAEARILVKEQGNRHRIWKEKQEVGDPTPKQLAFLFREKIPIPLDLTFLQASILIGERLAQIQEAQALLRQAQAAEKAAREEQWRQTFRERYPVGDPFTDEAYGEGSIQSNNGEFMLIRFEDGGERLYRFPTKRRPFPH